LLAFRAHSGPAPASSALDGARSGKPVILPSYKRAPQKVLVNNFPTEASEFSAILSIPGIRNPTRRNPGNLLASNLHLAHAGASCGAHS